MSLPNYSVLGLDPGGSTGLFYVRFSPDKPMMILRDQWDWSDVVNRLPEWLGSDRKPDAVVAERFVITARTAKLTQQQTAIEVIGVARYLCQRNGIPFTLQTKSNVAKLANDDRLKSVKLPDGKSWYAPGHGHANDAARHVFGFLASTQPQLFKTLIT